MPRVRLALLLVLGFAISANAQNIGDCQVFPGGCNIFGSGTVSIYRLPDTTNAYRTVSVNSSAVWESYLALPGLYRIKVNTTPAKWVGNLPHIPIVAIGGDSTSNAGRLIQNALDSLPSTGGVIYLPPGTHLVDSTTITVNKDNVRIVGMGDNCILKAANSLNAYVFTVANGTDNFSFENFVINGNKGNQTAGGGFNVNGSTIRRGSWNGIRIRHTYDAGIVLANTATDFNIENCYFDSIGTAGQTSTTAAFGIYAVTSVQNVRIEGCTFTWWSGTAAVRINNNCKNFFLQNNLYRANDKTGSADRRAVFADSSTDGACDNINIFNDKAVDIDENGFFLNNTNNSTIANSTADSCGNHGFELNGANLSLLGLQSRRSGSTGIIVNNGKGGVIADCISELNGERGIYVFTATGDSSTNLTIKGNVCTRNSQDADTTYAGLEVGETGTGIGRGITIIGNSCGDAGAAPKQRFGIQINGTGIDWYTIVGNIVTPKGSGAASGLNDGGGSNKYVPAGGNP